MYDTKSIGTSISYITKRELSLYVPKHNHFTKLPVVLFAIASFRLPLCVGSPPNVTEKPKGP